MAARRRSITLAAMAGAFGLQVAAVNLAAPPVRARPSFCFLFQGESELQPSSACRVCHGGCMNHPVDVAYEAAAVRRRGSLWPHDEAVRRGAFLPDGELRCVSCHDRRSSCRSHLAVAPHECTSLDRHLCLKCHTRV
jgi:hypothetical protein